jgi:antitoxin (DNA-binding transcriptional repressor) of toxin-antitoxin stability system
MKCVGIKALKHNLSRTLQYVRAGEIVWVTDRDEVIAEIHQPTIPSLSRVSRWDAWLNAQERSGQLRRARVRAPSLGDGWNLPQPERPLDLKSLLGESRSDRF